MVAPYNGKGNSLARYINVFSLIIGVAIILFLPLKKEIWYDETVSILCSKGISHDSPGIFTASTSVTSEAINELNMTRNVFRSTVVDNGNSFLYNIGLHWFTLWFGNSIAVYMLFSKLWGIAALLAFFAFCNMLFNRRVYTALAVFLLSADYVFVGMSHEIRAYSMGIFFVTMAGFYFYRFLFRNESPLNLFLTGMFAAGAILTHFLTVYIISVMLAVLLYRKRAGLFTLKNIAAMLLPVGIVAAYFFLTYSGIKTMNIQNHAVQERFTSDNFSIGEVIFRSLKIFSMNFKIEFPAFLYNKALIVCSALFVAFLCYAGLRLAGSPADKKNLYLLFLLGAVSSLFLVALSIKSQHYVSLYFRYYSFGLPFSCLFVAYLVFVLFNNPKVNRYVTGALLLVIILPVGAFFVSCVRTENHDVKYNHVAVANEILTNNIVKIEVPDWREAFLIQSVLPHGYKIDYFRNSTTSDFILYKADSMEHIAVIKQDR